MPGQLQEPLMTAKLRQPLTIFGSAPPRVLPEWLLRSVGARYQVQIAGGGLATSTYVSRVALPAPVLGV